MTVERLYQRTQLPCILRRVIDSSHKGILKGKSSSCLFKIILTGLHQLCNGILIGDRHELSSLFIRCGMQGKSQCNLQLFLCQFLNLRHQSTGRNCHIPLADMKPVLIGKQSKKPEQVLIIIERFPGSHDYHIGNALLRVSCNRIDLIKHLCRCQIPLPAIECRGTEPASHLTPYLGRNAHTVSMLITHEHTLYEIPVL